MSHACLNHGVIFNFSNREVTNLTLTGNVSKYVFNLKKNFQKTAQKSINKSCLIIDAAHFEKGLGI